MEEFTEYIYVTKADINEGFSTGTVSKSAIFFTKNYIFTLPFDSVNVFGGEGIDQKYKSVHEYVNELMKRIKETHIEDFENEMKSVLPEDNVFVVNELEKIEIKVGFGPFGGMAVKKKGKERKAINIQPKETRQKIKDFYKM